jgi:hypothetical protein
MIRLLIPKIFITFLPFFLFAGSEGAVDKPNWEIGELAVDGSTITLSDGTYYEVSHPYRQVVTRWQANQHHEVAVVNTRNGNLDYPIDIQNKVTGEKVQVRLPATVPEAPTDEAPSEEDESD